VEKRVKKTPRLQSETTEFPGNYGSAGVRYAVALHPFTPEVARQLQQRAGLRRFLLRFEVHNSNPVAEDALR
jgi:hypothetical protein